LPDRRALNMFARLARLSRKKQLNKIYIELFEQLNHLTEETYNEGRIRDNYSVEYLLTHMKIGRVNGFDSENFKFSNNFHGGCYVIPNSQENGILGTNEHFGWFWEGELGDRIGIGGRDTFSPGDALAQYQSRAEKFISDPFAWYESVVQFITNNKTSTLDQPQDYHPLLERQSGALSDFDSCLIHAIMKRFPGALWLNYQLFKPFFQKLAKYEKFLEDENKKLRSEVVSLEATLLQQAQKAQVARFQIIKQQEETTPNKSKNNNKNNKINNNKINFIDFNLYFCYYIYVYDSYLT
jgi:hypothetical protein